jgi:PTH1 family peptidyl-tRNA hydrolase
METAQYDWLIIGLGNPGKKYAATRHNIGWMVAITLCDKYGKSLSQSSSNIMQTAMEINGERLLVALPLTYMNNSGEAVIELVERYSIPLDRVLVIADEYNYPVGKLHLRLGGSDGGHNGIYSVIECLDSTDFIRLRCGIGKDFPAGMLVDYVLASFPKEQIQERDSMILKAVDSIECLIRTGLAKAMSMVNSGSLWRVEEKEISEPKNDLKPII